MQCIAAYHINLIGLLSLSVALSFNELGSRGRPVYCAAIDDFYSELRFV